MKVFCTDRRKEWDWGTATDRTMDEIEAVMRWCGPLILGVACEWPAYFDDAGGRMAAVKDDLSKIVFMVGRVAQLCYSKGNYNFTPVPVAHWKGQLPKPAVEARIRRNLQRTRPEGITVIEEVAPTSTCSKGHVWDAVGIGLYTLGDF